MKTGKRLIAFVMTMLMVLSCWVWIEPVGTVKAANQIKNKYLFAYFTDNSSDGQTVHLAVSNDGLHYTALRNNEPVIVPSKGTGAVRDPYIWYNSQDNYYYLIATDMDASNDQWWNNCNGFIMWRSKDLVHWYDETFINVRDLLLQLGKDVNLVNRAWAPQIMWDGQSYVIYFSLIADNNAEGSEYYNRSLSIVYFKTSDLLDLKAYYDLGVILSPGYDVNDAEIVQHPTNGKWYLFYKPENGNVKINMLVSDNATGPYTSPDANNSAGLDVFSTVNEALEGGNGFFDHNGDFVLYADAFGHGTSYFYVAKTDADGDFKSWTVYGESAHNINSLSPRHGSVVPITTEEYNRLLNNAYGITSSSFSANEDLSDYLIARYFTTADPTYNAANGKKDLTINGTLTAGTDALQTIGYYYKFNGSSYAEIDLETLAGGDFKNGFTITFTALTTSGSNSRFYEIADNFGQQTDGKSHYTHFAPAGDNGGAYIGNYNGPSGINHKWTAANKNYNDSQLHEYIVSYANGNTIVYCDGELIIKMNRFDNAGTNDVAWYDAIRNATMWIGKSGWSADPLFAGTIADFCIYNCSMSYYDVKTIQNEQDIEAGLNGVTPTVYSGITSKVPTFQNTDAAKMQSLPNASQHFSNILYTSNTVKNYDGNNMSADSAVCQKLGCGDLWVALYYPKTTVLLLDGVNDAIMPISFGAYCENKRDGKGFYNIYPTTGAGSTADNNDVEISQNWGGWYNNGDYYNCIVKHEDGYIGRNSTTTSWSQIKNQANYDGHWGAPLKVKNTIDFGSSYFKKLNLTWQINGNYKKNGSEQSGHSVNFTASKNDIFVINYKPMVTLRNTTIPNEYNSIVSNTSYCPATIEAYKSVVEAISKFDPNNYDYAANATSAVQACADEIAKLINDYNTVKANLGACKTLAFPATEATCTAPGFSAGSYCEYCGKVFADQQTVGEALGHIFVDVDATKSQCTRCGEIRAYAPIEIRYENLFSFNAWAKAPNNSIGWSETSTTISANMIEGSITIFNGRESGEVYSNASGTTRNTALYAIPVEGGKTYVYEFTATGSYAGEVFIFKYAANGNCTGVYGDTNVSGTGTVSKEFTVESNTAYVEFRFDANAPGTITYTDIGLYTKESFDNFAKNNKDARLAYYTDENKKLCTPERDGYEFLGWSTDKNATKATYAPGTSANAVAKSGSTVLYSVWAEKKYTVKFNANGGTGSIADKTVKYADSFNLPADGFTRNGYTFLGWSANKNATYATYAPGQSVSKLTETTGATITLYAVWAENVVNAVDDTVVIEYGLPIEINVLKNDAFATNVTAIGTSAPNTGSVKNTTRAFEGTSLILANGNVTLEDGKITYTPTTTNTTAQEFYYEVTANGNYYYAKVTVIPATSMYYEDTFFKFENATIEKDGETYDYIWDTVGKVFDAFQSDELDEAYGYDSAYDNQVAYSGGAARVTTVDANVTATNGPTATFTFTGTGFDLFTVTDYESGMVTATIYNSEGARVKGVMANAYFGYDYNEETKEYEPADNGAIYQVPIIKARDLDYGTYTVVIAPRYNKAFDVTNAGNCKVYVDSVRIYDPMGDNNSIADDAYMADKEYAPEYLSIRDTIVQANKDGSYANLGAGTSVYLDGGITDIENYLKNGPKSEVYLGKGNSVAFHIVTKSNIVPATIQIGMRTTGINGSTADVKLMNGGQDKWQTVALNSTTERFYNIESVVDWTMLDDGTYKTATPIIITNNSDAVISLTSLKWAFDGTSAQTELYVMSDETTPRIAMFAIRRAVQTEAQDTILNPENIAFSFSEDAYTVGDSGILTVVTEQGVEAVTVNGEDAIFNCTDDNDKMLWTYDFSADAVGTMTFEIVAADENGFTSESVYATTEIKDVVVDNTPETPEDNDDSDGLGGFMNIFKSISDLINKIIDIIKKMFTFMMGGITE